MPWLGSSRMIDGTTFPYPLSLHHHYQTNPPTDPSVISGPPHPILPPTPYMPIMSPLGGGAFHVPSGTPSYAMFGNRSGDGVGIHPYSTYATLSHTPSHVERPYAQYPSPLQPVPGYILPSSLPVSEHHETSTSSSNISLHNPQNSNSHQLRRSGTSKGGSVPPHQEESARFQSPITQVWL